MGEDLDTTAAARTLNDQAERLIVESRQFDEEDRRRRYVADGVVQGLRSLGFQIESDSPALEHTGYPASALLIKATRPEDSGAVAVSVRHGGEVVYAIGGDPFPRTLERATDGQTYSHCDAAEQQLRSLHRIIQDRFEIVMSDLRWDDQPPRLGKTEHQPLPETQTPRRHGAP